MRTKYKHFAVSIGIIIAITAFIMIINHIYIQAPRTQLVNSAKVGMSRSEVIAHLGQPDHIARSLKELDPRTYDFNYVPIPTIPVDKEILEYYKGAFWKIYIYINNEDRVTRVEVAKT